MIDELVITPRGDGAREARLADYLWAGPEPDRASWALRGGERWRITTTCRSTGDELRRVVVVSSPSGQRIDRLDFLLTEGRFVERATDGRLLADLPAVLERGRPHPLVEGGEVRLDFAGPVIATLGERREELDALVLVAQVEGERRIQWLGRGVGELALGPMDGGFDRWLTGWTAGGRTLFGGVS